MAIASVEGQLTSDHGHFSLHGVHIKYWFMQDIGHVEICERG